MKDMIDGTLTLAWMLVILNVGLGTSWFLIWLCRRALKRKWTKPHKFQADDWHDRKRAAITFRPHKGFLLDKPVRKHQVPDNVSVFHRKQAT